MGQSQSRADTRGRDRHSLRVPVQTTQDTAAAVGTSSTADAPPSTLTSSTAPVVDAPVLPATNSTRPLSGRFSQFSMRSRRRSVAADELGQQRPPDVTRTTKRSWLGRIRSRTTSRSSAHAQPTPGSTSIPHDELSSALPDPTPPVSTEPTPIDEPRPSPVAPVADGLTSGAAVQTPDSAPTTAPTSATVQNQAAQDLGIPPPGSLIIVQGIVQTQDGATSQPNTVQATPARGSRFFDRRRRSQQDVRPGTSESAQQSEFDPSASQTTTATGSEAPSAPEDSTNPAQISQSSIDVLGTLLSFATAATAASLVTGSISPLFSSGLTSAAAAAGGGEDARRDGSEEPRPRSVLNTMRERFRRRAAGGTEGSTDEMLGELSRAISQGLEIGRPEEVAAAATAPLSAVTSTGTTGSDSATASTSGSVPSLSVTQPSEDVAADTASPPPSRPQTAQQSTPAATSLLVPPEAQTPTTPTAGTPSADTAPSSNPRRPRASARGGPRADAPEGSFERFLYSLQVDLRRALTEDQAARAANSDAASTAPSATANQGTDMPATPTTAAGESAAGTEEQTPAEGTRRDGQVNWWRLYRFPPTRMPAGANVAGAEPGATPSATPSAATGTATSGATPAPGPASAFGSAAAAAAATPAAERPLVVPVIVVGLQSVRPADLASAIPENVRQELENAVNGGANGAAAAGTDRVRGSRTSRVLNRLSNLPPWRTNQAPSDDAAAAAAADTVPSTPVTDPSSSTPSVAASGAPPAPTGGRTWLLYVIGGYFSLQHALVTGDVNSFEALWQLADLLGQVKPPVASKDDIERSGLTIFKATSLPDMLKEGKVAENCVDRCLICLEDYEATEDLRLMSCRHAFHQTCIDQWLQQGKNNCPACRAKGVSVQGDTPDGAAAADPAAAPTMTPVASTSTTTPPTPGE